MKVYTIKHFLLLIIMLRGIICFSQNNNLRVQNDTIKLNDLYGWISLMSQLIIINRALYVNKQQEGKICAIT